MIVNHNLQVFSIWFSGNSIFKFCSISPWFRILICFLTGSTPGKHLFGSGRRKRTEGEVDLRLNEQLWQQDPFQTKSKEYNKSLDEFFQASDGRLAFHLFREFLDFFNLKYTLSVFEAEMSAMQGTSKKTRNQLIDGLGLGELVDPKAPVMSEIISLSKVSVLKSETPTSTELTNRYGDKGQPCRMPVSCLYHCEYVLSSFMFYNYSWRCN